jgi:GAF domain-containing protein
LQSKRDLQDPADLNQETAQYYLYLTDLLLREALKGEESLSCLHNLTGMLGMSLKAVRVSIVRCDLETRRGFVMASNDKRSIGGLAINLVKYPEMIYVLREGKTLAVDNLAGDPTLYFVTQQHKEISFNSMLVCPVQIAGQNWGVLSVRMPEVKKQLHDFEIRFAQLVAHVAALIVRMDPTLQTALPPVDLGKP